MPTPMVRHTRQLAKKEEQIDEVWGGVRWREGGVDGNEPLHPRWMF